MIKSIEVTNFRKLESGKFNFTDGLNIICGENAAGKTTLTYAITFALYGAKSVLGKLENIPTWGEKDCKVVLELEGFAIERTIKNCKVTSESGEMLASGNSVCSDYIEENITGVDLKGFKLLNWSPQGETGALLTLGATQIQRDVEKFSGVEFIDKVIRASASDLATLKSKLEDREESDKTPKEIIKENRDLTLELGTVSENISSCLEAEEASVKTKTINKDKLIKARHINSKIRLDREELVGIQERLIQAETRLEVAEDYLKTSETALSKANPVLEEEVKRLEEVIENCVEQLQTHNNLLTKKSTIEDQLKALKGKADEDTRLSNALELSRNKVDSFEKSKISSTQECAMLKDKVNSLEIELNSGICQECGSVLSTDKRHTENLKEGVNKALRELETLTLERQSDEVNYINALKEFKTASKAYDIGHCSAAKTETILINNLTVIEEALSLLILSCTKEEVKTIQEKMVKLKQDKASFSRLKDETMSRKVSETVAKSKVSNLQTELSLLSAGIGEEISETILSVYEDEIETCESVISKMAALKSFALAEKVQLSLKIEDLNNLLKYLKLTNALETEFSVLDKFVKLIKKHRGEFLEAIWSQILGSASGFLTRSTDGVITELTRDPKEGFMFLEGGHLNPVAVASGAQKGFIGVATRLALAESLNASMQLTILDEPTEAMREENALNLSGALIGRSQVIMVTHKVTDSMSASNIIEV